ncbi:activating transcription factor 7-interacting protein 1 [Topomyia yanbarensis]|uniref:activating transcription factor 7-interacting protein 1 n=1 Tax=Topomyia yanbarensis TaxID=2498891 RepID=UPI00273C8C13|nr:activating transcription factor 7-interacting protein 1 [Topomyia yanbarensis]XP_058837170.1 activating transcription factor 7-interacting protein 1 [Topomyia yanbarensis]XP_058837172.1 activating transcription factor 7-interacting protein 1 [Topomyia yanbarensis]XP_058837173.1 activating transcription factor 7-interacting protein 1 [Topomyia yanbarensis]XP_058837174.1 activating transcription factor 7-interacting protein 1 [Topomyia yanbarensis]XP_058837175.1 activating transcription facto
MMEVNQPLGTGVLELQKMSSTSAVASSAESLQDISPEVKQNGISVVDKTLSEVTMDIDDTKAAEDEDSMERLTYGDLDDVENEDQATDASANQTELAQTISDTLIEDIILLNKSKKHTDDKNMDGLEEEQCSEQAPPSVQSSTEREGTANGEDENINGIGTVEEGDTLMELDELPPPSTNGVSELDEEENLLLLEEDDVEMDVPHEADETLLLEEEDIGVEAEEEDGTSPESAIQIEDSVVIEENADATAVTDGSIMTIDESGLSILNTAAVDIGDVTADVSVRMADEKETLETTISAEIIPEDSSVTEDTEQLNLLSTAEQNEEPPVFALMEEMVTSIADNLKPGDSEAEPTVELEEEEEERFATPQLSPELSDLIKFPDVEKIVAEVEQNDAPDSAVVGTECSENTDLMESPGDNTIVEDKPASEDVLSAAKTSEVEVSDLIKFDSAIVAEEESNQEEIEPELSDLIKFKNDCTSKEEPISEQPEDVAIPEAPRENLPESVDVKTEDDKTPPNDTEEAVPAEDANILVDEVDQQLPTCRQALQAADEEDLLEMMEEPDRMEADDENGEEDPDDHSSESGSAKQTQADDEDDFEGSDCTGMEEDEASRNTEDREEVADGTDDVHSAEDEITQGEPPSKRKCSVDVREAQEEKCDKDTKVGEDSLVVQDKSSDQVVEATAEPKKPETDAKGESKASVVMSEEMDVADEVTEKPEETVAVKESTPEEVPGIEQADEPSPAITESKKSNETVAQNETEVKPDEVIEAKVEENKQDTADEDIAQKDLQEAKSEKVEEVDPSDKTVVEEMKLSEEQESETITVKNDSVKGELPMDIEQSGQLSKMDVESKEVKTCKEEEAMVEEKESSEKKSQETEVKDKSAQDEVLIIDDDEDVPEKKEPELKSETDSTGPAKDDSSAVITGKRPCPEDQSEEKDGQESVKKIRLTEEKIDPVKVEDNDKEPKEEIKEESAVEERKKPKEEKKSALETIEALKLVLNPEPVEPPKEKKTIRLDFLDKFKKPLEKMNRSDLEEFVLQKIVESVAFKSTIAEMRTQLDGQDVLLLGYRQKVHDLNKQFKDLEMVHERVVKDLEKKNQHFVTPVKITRAVGLQVSQPRFVSGNRQSMGNVVSGTNSPKGTINRSPVGTPSASPNRSAPQAIVQNRRTSFGRAPPVVIKACPQPNSINRPTQPTTLSKPSPASSSATPTTNKGVSALQSQTTNTSSPQQHSALPAASPTTPSPGTVPPLTRKKPLQKFTPMRPPLSITQQVQQQQQTRQMQEQLMRQQIQDVHTGANNTTNGTGSQPQSPVTQSPQGSPLTRTPEPAASPLGTTPARVPPIVMKKVTPQAKGTPATMQIINRQTPSMVTAVSTANVRTVQAVASVATPTTPVMDNSLIDLTDEDDTPKPATAASPATASTATAPQAAVVPKPPITILNGQQQHYVQRQNASMPPLVVINQQQRVVNRAVLHQRPMAGTQTGGMVNGIGTPTRPMLVQRPGNASNGFPRAIATQQAYKPRMANGQMDMNRRIIARSVRQPTPAPTHFTHPAPLPQPGIQANNPAWKQAPPRPSIRINNIETGIVISWTMDDLSEIHATIVSYQIYAYQETTAPPSMDMWRHVGDVKAMLLPMAVTLTQFQEGQRYHFAVRAVDEHQRVGQFSPPRTWNESTPGKVA